MSSMNMRKVILGFALSLLLGNGVVVAADFNKGMKAYDSGDFKAALVEWVPLAEQGDAEAQYSLGIMHDVGEGVLIDYKRAYMWFNLSSYNGSGSATNKMDALAKKMSHAQIDKAQDMSRRCLESDYKYCGVTEKEAEKLAEAEKWAEVAEIIESIIADGEAVQQLAEDQQMVDSLLVDEEAQTQALEKQATDGQAVASAVQYIRNEIIQKWVRPANARTGMVVELVIQLLPTGEILSIGVSYRDASATDAFVASVVKAVNKVGRFDKLSQLDSALFDANFRKVTLVFKPEDLRL